jgi:hypothetical protein
MTQCTWGLKKCGMKVWRDLNLRFIGRVVTAPAVGCHKRRKFSWLLTALIQSLRKSRIAPNKIKFVPSAWRSIW